MELEIEFRDNFIPANTRPIKRSVSLGSANNISRLPTVIFLYPCTQMSNREFQNS